MSEYDQLSDNRALVRSTPPEETAAIGNENSRDFRAQVQQYGQQASDAFNVAKTRATEYFGQANEKFKDLQGKDVNHLAEEAKDYARRKPTQALAITAAAGLVLGLLLGRRR